MTSAVQERVRILHRRLQRRYRSADLGNHTDPLDETVFIVLSKQTREDTYCQLYQTLHSRVRGDWSALAEVDRNELEEILRPGGFQRQRAEQLVQLVTAVRERCEARGLQSVTLDWLTELEDISCEKELVSLPGVGPKTARCVMGYSLGRNVLAVDTHVARVMGRLSLVESSPGKPDHTVYEAAVPSRIRVRFHMNLVHHGREVCTSRAPKCDRCCIVTLCTSSSIAAVRVTPPQA